MRWAVAACACLAGGVLVVQALSGGGHAKVPAELAVPRSPYSQQPVVVDVYEFGFSPTRIVVTAGQTVAWKDTGKQFHVVTPDTRRGRAVWAAARDEGSAAHLFSTPGRYPYHCAIHRRMRGVVVVRRRT